MEREREREGERERERESEREGRREEGRGSKRDRFLCVCESFLFACVFCMCVAPSESHKRAERASERDLSVCNCLSPCVLCVCFAFSRPRKSSAHDVPLRSLPVAKSVPCRHQTATPVTARANSASGEVSQGLD